MIAEAILDLGNTQLKGKRSTGAECNIPHALVEISGAQFENIQRLTGKGEQSNDFLQIEGRYFVFGERAEEMGMISAEQGVSRYRRDYIGLLAVRLLVELYPATVSQEFSLFVSHPPGHVRYTDDLMRSIFGNWHIETSAGKQLDFRIGYVNVFDEPMGGLSNVMLTADGTNYADPQFKDSRTLVIDIGGGTTDFLVIREDGNPDYANTDSISLGINDILIEFEKALQNRHAATLKSARTLLPARVREALATGEFRGGGGDPLPVHEEASQLKNKLINRVLQMYRTRFGGGTNYDAILLTGGGSGLLLDDLTPHLENRNIRLAEDVNNIHMANVRGGLKLWKLYKAIGITGA